MTVLTDFLDEHGVEYRLPGQHHHATRSFVQTDCCWCSPGSGAFRLGLAARTATCWTCGRQPVLKTLMELTGASYARCRQVLGNVDGGDLPNEPLRGKLVLPWGLGPLLGPHKDYLRSRRLDPEQAERLYGVQGIGLAAKFAWRLFFPAHSHGKIVSWTTRNLADPGYWITAKPEEERLALKDQLLGVDYCRHAVLAVEGPLDMLAGGPGTVATAGASWTQAQALALARFPVRVVAFDADDAGRERAAALVILLSPLPGKTINVETKTAKDLSRAADWERREIRKRFLEDQP